MTNAMPHHSRISFTAKLVALARSHTDIPFAQDVAGFVGAADLAALGAGEQGVLDKTHAWLAPIVEARYKSLVQAIHRSGVRQVLEFASGVSLRGLMMTRRFPDLTYVESDLPEITEEKRLLVESLRAHQGISQPASHHIVSANILDWDQIEGALAYFDPAMPVAVIHEGLLMYLSMAEKEQAARHIHRILSRCGGVWITPDFAPMDDRAWHGEETKLKPFRALMAAIEERTGRSFAALSFASEDAVRDFCTRLGFEMTVTPQVDGSFALTSAATSQLSPPELAAMTSALKLWELRVPS